MIQESCMFIQPFEIRLFFILVFSSGIRAIFTSPRGICVSLALLCTQCLVLLRDLCTFANSVDGAVTKKQSSPALFKYCSLNVLFPERAFYLCRSRNLGCYCRCCWWTWGYSEHINSTIPLCSFIIYLTSALSYYPSLSAQVSLCSLWRIPGS